MSASDEKNDLLNAILPFSVDSIEKYGEFHPHGAALREDGEIRPAMADIGVEHPKPDDLIDALVAGFKGAVEKGEIRAAAIATNVIVRTETGAVDAIQVVIEHRDDDAIAVYMPYGRADETSAWQFGELEAQHAESRIFT